jgi:hypothetical protein
VTGPTPPNVEPISRVIAMSGPEVPPEVPTFGTPLTPEAQRALAEAEARRAAQTAYGTTPAEEIGGRKGPDPVRFGDWEVGGIASDF